MTDKHKRKKRQLSFSLVIVLLMFLWFITPSSFFVRSTATSFNFDTNTVTFTRRVPFGTTYGQVFQELSVPHADHLECSTKEWQKIIYQADGPQTVPYKLGDWADDCLALGPPFVLRTSRQVVLFNLVPLRVHNDPPLIIER